MSPATVDPTVLGGGEESRAADHGISLDMISEWPILYDWNELDALGGDLRLPTGAIGKWDIDAEVTGQP